MKTSKIMKTSKTKSVRAALSSFILICLLSGCADPFYGNDQTLVWGYWDRLWTPMSGIELYELKLDNPKYDMLEEGYEIMFGAALGDVHFYDSFIFMDMSAYSTPMNKEYRKDAVFVSKKSEDFHKLCEKHNDFPENNPFNAAFFTLSGLVNYEMNMYHFYKDFERLEIQSDKDFDEKHPAGTSLLDIVHYGTNSPSRLLDNGYQTKFEKDALNGENYPFVKGTFVFSEYWSFINIWKKGSDVQNNDLKILSSYYIAFDQLPSVPGPHNIIITMTDEDGKQYKFEKTLTFDKLPRYDEWVSKYLGAEAL